MGSSEDYLDNLLKSMGVPGDVTASGEKTSDPDELSSPVSTEIEELSERLPDSGIFVDHSADIPDLKTIIEEDPAASDVHIDSAPSLDMNSANDTEQRICRIL